MDEETPRKRRTTKFSRSARNKRIVERLREGFGYDEIAREEKLTERRVRQIVKEALEGREALASAIHAICSSTGSARRCGSRAKRARGDVRAVAPFIKSLEKLDRYQSLAREAAPRVRKSPTRDCGFAGARRSDQRPGSRRVQAGGGPTAERRRRTEHERRQGCNTRGVLDPPLNRTGNSAGNSRKNSGFSALAAPSDRRKPRKFRHCSKIAKF
jgi:hypothetical protein